MAFRSGRPTRLSIKRDIRQIIRTFPSVFVRVERLTVAFNEDGEQVGRTTVYEGDALVRPAGGSAATYGLGTVENYKLVILINGDHDIRQGDVVAINQGEHVGRQYEVMFPPTWFESFQVLNLETRSQITQ